MNNILNAFLSNLFFWTVIFANVIFGTSVFQAFAQDEAQSEGVWEWEELATMPQAISNNSVTAATIDGVPHVFSFSGIDTSKIYSGISNKSFRYNVETNEWDTIPDLPMDLTVIAAGASTVKNKIYIAGGYHVLASGNEISVDNIHIYDPETNTYTAGAPIPIAIDDQVQAVWRDSLIYLVTGWSQNGNVPDVQIYDTANDVWLEGTPVENNNIYRAFGASGAIIEDTIYYTGGSSPFVLRPFLRKGIINPENPTEIEWSFVEDSLALGYRAAATTFKANEETEEQAMWLGGGLVSYNYDGIAYNGSGGVPATDRLVFYSPKTDSLTSENGLIPPTMDLRGLAKISDTEFIVAGGMKEEQMVTDRTFALRWVEPMDTMVNDTMMQDTMMNDTTMMGLFSIPSSINASLEKDETPYNIGYNRENAEVRILSKRDIEGDGENNEYGYIADIDMNYVVQVLDANARVVMMMNEVNDGRFSMAHLPNGLYFIRISVGSNELSGVWTERVLKY